MSVFIRRSPQTSLTRFFFFFFFFCVLAEKDVLLSRNARSTALEVPVSKIVEKKNKKSRVKKGIEIFLRKQYKEIRWSQYLTKVKTL